MKHGDKLIVVDSDYYYAIQQDSEFLEILDSCGIHTWSGYKEAEEMYIQEKTECT